MKFGALPTLQAVVRRGNFAAAANELGLTASAVSQQMRQLEDYFGQPLFDRSARSVKPTSFALEVVATAESALAGLQALRDRSRPEARGRVRLGVINSVQLSTLPAILRAASHRYPELHVVLEPENTSGQLLESLKAGDIDAAVVVRQRGSTSRQLVWNPLAEEAFVLVYPRDYHGPASVRRIVQALPWVRYNLALEGGRIASSFVRHVSPGLQPRYEVMTTDAVIAMVSEGLGFSVIPQPRRAILEALPVSLVRLGRQIPPRQILLARRSADSENRRIEALLTCIRDVYAHIEKI